MIHVYVYTVNPGYIRSRGNICHVLYYIPLPSSLDEELICSHSDFILFQSCEAGSNVSVLLHFGHWSEADRKNCHVNFNF